MEAKITPRTKAIVAVPMWSACNLDALQAIAMGANKSKRLNANLTIPGTVPVGEYELVAVIDSSEDVVEEDETNNEVLWQQQIVVAQPFWDLRGEVVNPKLPTGAVVSGDGTRITLPIASIRISLTCSTVCVLQALQRFARLLQLIWPMPDANLWREKGAAWKI